MEQTKRVESASLLCKSKKNTRNSNSAHAKLRGSKGYTSSRSPALSASRSDPHGDFDVNVNVCSIQSQPENQKMYCTSVRVRERFDSDSLSSQSDAAEAMQLQQLRQCTPGLQEREFRLDLKQLRGQQVAVAQQQLELVHREHRHRRGGRRRGGGRHRQRLAELVVGVEALDEAPLLLVEREARAARREDLRERHTRLHQTRAVPVGAQAGRQLRVEERVLNETQQLLLRVQLHRRVAALFRQVQHAAFAIAEVRPEFRQLSHQSLRFGRQLINRGKRTTVRAH